MKNIPTVKYYAIDYGRQKIVLSWGSDDNEYLVYSQKKKKREGLAAIMRDLPPGAIVIAEESMGSYNFIDHNEALDIAIERGITLRSVSNSAVHNYRRTIGHKKPRHGKLIEDIADARYLLKIFGFDGCKRGFGSFKKRYSKPIPTDLRGAIQATLINARRFGAESWEEAKIWLKSHRLPTIPAACSALEVAWFIRANVKTRQQKTYRDFTRIYERSHINPIHRSNATHHVYRNHAKYSTLLARKTKSHELHHLFSKIWKLTEKKEPCVTDFVRE